MPPDTGTTAAAAPTHAAPSQLTMAVSLALLLGLANAIVRPILTVITFPLTIVTFGLFLLVVNAAVIGLVASLLGGFAVDGLWAGIGAAIVTGVVSWVAGWFIGPRPEARRD